MKPSERDPSACLALVELLKEAGMPDGVVSIIHGQHDAVNFICDHPDIRAISFVGETCKIAFVERIARMHAVLNEGIFIAALFRNIRNFLLVGGDRAGHHIYTRGSSNGKRVQCNMGAKNHGVIMPDANKEYTINQLVGAAFGAAGQRCMALSTAVMVGEAKDW